MSKASVLSFLPLFPLLLGAAACADDPQEPNIDTSQQTIVGGETMRTSLRPEVGVFFSLTSRCTATLIGPQYVLTAAHCLSPPFTGSVEIGTDPLSGYHFDLAGEVHGVDRIHSFSTKLDEYAPGTLGTTDVALVHLVAPASPRPAALSPNPPRIGDLSTLFGFGCTSRIGATGGGFKQFFSFLYGTRTASLCWGDSGGPVFFGSVDGAGAIWGTNSLIDALGTDIFGAVSFYKAQIESMLHTWDGNLEIGMNRSGADYASFAVPSAAACGARCQEDGKCHSFTFDSANGLCFLKTGLPDMVPSPGATSGVPSRFEADTNRPGADLAPGFVPTPATAEGCASACSLDQRCVAFTFDGSNESCWLKGTVPAAEPCSFCTSGVFDRSFERDTNRPGGDLRSESVGSALECAKDCAADARCLAYTFTNEPRNNCWIKGSVSEPSPMVGTISGLRRGLEMNTNRAGNDYRNFVTSNLTPNECQAACIREGQCRAWTYVPPPSNAPYATCYLKNTIPAVGRLDGAISGVRGLEFLP